MKVSQTSGMNHDWKIKKCDDSFSMSLYLTALQLTGPQAREGVFST
jgi:hypothetical protein